MSELGKLALLSGGPLDGKVCLASSASTPVILIGSPRQLGLLDEPEFQADWDDDVRWYVARVREPARV